MNSVKTTSDILEFDKFYDHLCSGIVITDAVGNIEFINSKLQDYLQSINAEVKECLINIFEPPHNLHQKIIMINQHEFIVKLLKKEVVNSSDYYVFMVLSTNEIINLIPNLSYVLQQKNQFQNILDCIHDRIYVVNGKGNIIMINKAVERDGEIRENLEGTHMAELVKEGYMKESLSLKILKTKMPQGYIHHEPEGYDLLSWGIPHLKNGEIDLVVCTEWDLDNLNVMKKLLNNEEKIPSNIQSELAYYRMKSSISDKIIAESPQMKKLIETAGRIARSDSTVLIQGESGTGKEVLMKYIHSKSPRFSSPLIELNCGAIPENLIESELFGYEKGAFTGANSKGKLGFFELADQGTLFLDEIGELPLSAQTKLLRALQEKEIMRVGGNITFPIDVRIIAATNTNLLEAIEERLFRKDLFYRLNVIPLYIPPLRERKADIPHLVEYFINQYNLKYKTTKSIEKNDIEIFLNYNWPGNIRELENLIERVLLITKEDTIPRKNWVQQISYSPLHPNKVNINKKVSIKDEVAQFEKNLLLSYLPYYESSRQFAEMLGVEKSTINRKIKKYNIKIK